MRDDAYDSDEDWSDEVAADDMLDLQLDWVNNDALLEINTSVFY